MFTTPPLRRRSVLSALKDFAGFHPAAIVAHSRDRSVQRRCKEEVDRMPGYLVDDVGLLASQGYTTDQALLEVVTRMRSGWS